MKKNIKAKTKRGAVKKRTAKTKPKTKPKLKIRTRLKGKSKKTIKKKGVGIKTAVRVEKPIGRVTHFFNHINVAIVKFKLPVRLGTEVRLRGATTDFSTVIKSMQYDHKPITIAKKGQEVGIKIKKKVREGDSVYPA